MNTHLFSRVALTVSGSKTPAYKRGLTLKLSLGKTLPTSNVRHTSLHWLQWLWRGGHLVIQKLALILGISGFLDFVHRPVALHNLPALVTGCKAIVTCLPITGHSFEHRAASCVKYTRTIMAWERCNIQSHILCPNHLWACVVIGQWRGLLRHN